MRRGGRDGSSRSLRGTTLEGECLAREEAAVDDGAEAACAEAGRSAISLCARAALSAHLQHGGSESHPRRRRVADRLQFRDWWPARALESGPWARTEVGGGL